MPTGKRRDLLLAALFVAIAPLLARAARSDTPTPDAIVDWVVSPPKHAFQGHVMVNHWNGAKTDAEDISIYYRPSDNYRMEFLAPNGTVERVVRSNRFGEQVQLVTNGKIMSETLSKRPAKLLTSQNEKTLLLANYRIEVTPAEPFLGRRAWRVLWQPLTASKPVHEMRVDDATGVVLESKRFTDDGRNGTLLRFTEFASGGKAATTLFLEEKELAADNDELGLTAAIGSPLRDAPSANGILYGGFSVESVDDYEVMGKPVRHVRYTDGLLPISLFRTAIPVNMTGASAVSSGLLQVAPASAGEVCHWEKNKTYYTLIGDLPTPLLQEIARRLDN